MNKWSRRFEGSHAAGSPATPHFASAAHQYFAFLSYSHEDEAVADWLHRQLERFRVPSALVGRLTANGVIPKRLTPIFRDRHELAAAKDLGSEIREVLAASHSLIVLCSPAAARSKWTDAEIGEFKRLHPEGCIIAVIVDGEPFASEIPGREAEECFPPALRRKYDRRGRRTARKVEPLAADIRESGDGRRLALLKVVAGILGLGLDELVQRDHLRRQRRLAGIAGGSLAGMVVASALAVTAIQARDEARDQRREAESLVGFMVGDLKDRLEPIGRLDVLDSVATRALAYYQKRDIADLSDAGLVQRSQALTLMGQVSRDRGNLDRADAFYRAAYAGTAEAIRRGPEDPQRLFDHAQNAFYLGEIAQKRGRLVAVEVAFREYKDLADRMVALDPDSMKWRIEVQYAAANLGDVLYYRRDFDGAAQNFASALTTIEAFAAANPGNDDYQIGVTDALALLADAQLAGGKLSQAVQTRERHVALLSGSVGRHGTDARFRLVPGRRELGRLYAAQGRSQLAVKQLTAAVAEGERLIALEPDNSKWRESTLAAQVALASELLDSGNSAAAIDVAPNCGRYSRLIAQDPMLAARRAGFRDCLLLRARLALRVGASGEAARFAAQAVEAARAVNSTDRLDARFGFAKALRILGDARSREGNAAGAQSAWRQALEAMPRAVAEKPDETHERATILSRLGRTGEARALTGKLEAIGYRRAIVAMA